MKRQIFILILLLGLFYPTTVIESKTIVRNGVLCESDTLQKSTRSVAETGNGVSVTYTVSDVALHRVGSTDISRVSVPGFHKTYSPEATH